VFTNEASCLWLVSAILMEFSEEWEFGKIYLRIESSLRVLSNSERSCDAFFKKMDT